MEELLQQSQAAYDAAQAALKAGDLGLYQQKIDEAYRLASQAASQATGTTVVAVPSTTTPRECRRRRAARRRAAPARHHDDRQRLTQRAPALVGHSVERPDLSMR